MTVVPLYTWNIDTTKPRIIINLIIVPDDTDAAVIDLFLLLLLLLLLLLILTTVKFVGVVMIELNCICTTLLS
jgi:hypothetical protein